MLNFGPAGYAAAVAIVLGGMALLGWFLEWETLRRTFRNYPAMHPSTAILLVASGTAVVQAERQRILHQWLAAGVLAILACASAYAAFTGRWPFESATGLRPARMALTTALSLALLMIALLLTGALGHGRQAVRTSCTVVAAGMGLTGLIGYLFQLDPLYNFGSVSAMALPTALAVFSLACAIFLLDRNSSLRTLLYEQGSVARFGRQMLVMAFGLQIIFVLLRLVVQDQFGMRRELAVALFTAASVLTTLGLLAYCLLRLASVERVRREQEAALADANRAILHFSRDSAMATMAGTLAHELSQPLGAASNYAAALERLTAGMDHRPIQECVGGVRSSTMRAGEIMKRMRKVAEGSHVDKEPLHLRQIIDDTLRLLNNDCSGTQFKVVVSAELRPMGDSIQIQQVLFNLVRNSCQAVVGAAKKEVRITALDEGSYTRVSVVDSGPGLPPALVPNLFRVIASTKSDGHGLGLSICRTIVEAHGGEIAAKNLEEGGACFHFTLPNRPPQPRR